MCYDASAVTSATVFGIGKPTRIKISALFRYGFAAVAISAFLISGNSQVYGQATQADLVNSITNVVKKRFDSQMEQFVLKQLRSRICNGEAANYFKTFCDFYKQFGKEEITAC